MIPGLAPNKVAGMVYILLGFMMLIMAMFFAVVPGSFGVNTNWRLAICGMLVVYGVFRVVTGILKVRKASKEDAELNFNGHASAGDSLNGTRVPSVSKPGDDNSE